MIEIEGYVALFMRRNNFDDILVDTALDTSIEQFLNQDKPVSLVSNYDVSKVVGKITSLTKDTKGVFMEGEIMDLDTALEFRDRKFKGFSLIYKVRSSYLDNEGRTLCDIDLLAVNLTAKPPERNARVFERVLQT